MTHEKEPQPPRQDIAEISQKWLELIVKRKLSSEFEINYSHELTSQTNMSKKDIEKLNILLDHIRQETRLEADYDWICELQTVGVPLGKILDAWSNVSYTRSDIRNRKQNLADREDS